MARDVKGESAIVLGKKFFFLLKIEKDLSDQHLVKGK